MQTHLRVDFLSPVIMHVSSSWFRRLERRPLSQGEIYTLLLGRKGKGREFLCVTVSQLPSAQYNPYAKVASSGAAYSDPLHRHNASQIYVS